MILTNHAKELKKEENNLRKKLDRISINGFFNPIKTIVSSNRVYTSNKKKRKRKKKNEVKRDFVCPEKNCTKAYG